MAPYQVIFKYLMDYYLNKSKLRKIDREELGLSSSLVKEFNYPECSYNGCLTQIDWSKVKHKKLDLLYEGDVEILSQYFKDNIKDSIIYVEIDSAEPLLEVSKNVLINNLSQIIQYINYSILLIMLKERKIVEITDVSSNAYCFFPLTLV